MISTKAQRVVAVVPAREGSRRLPGKPLADLCGEPLVWRVVERVSACPLIERIVVATDAETIAAAVRDRGGEALLVQAPCASGTERVARAVEQLGPCDAVINVQGDEPFVDAEALSRLVGALEAGAPVATLAAPCSPEQRADPNSVKVVHSRGRAHYFSRAPIPGDLHLGVYGFSAAALRELAFLARGPLSRAEDLEQLAWLEAGHPIAVCAARPSLSIDTPADLASARRLQATLMKKTA